MGLLPEAEAARLLEALDAAGIEDARRIGSVSDQDASPLLRVYR